uniref:Dilute domain-containing protein n=1 Tax=Periophthalmus magnuspinnatus TaxID=409849 RepID=A0A3B3ZR48_9GOBI
MIQKNTLQLHKPDAMCSSCISGMRADCVELVHFKRFPEVKKLFFPHFMHSAHTNYSPQSSLQVLYPLLPDVLDCNPFRRSPDTPDPTDGSPVLGSPPLRAPEEVQKVVEVLNQTWRLLQTCQLHPEISAQLVGYLFYFINASLFNSLMERGSEEGFYQWSRGVHLRASLDLILDWAQERGLGELALEQTIKLSGALNLLATPRKTLLKTCWSSLRSLYPSLHPAQLHHLLSLYRPLSHPRSTWSPSAPDQDAALDTGKRHTTLTTLPLLYLARTRAQT